MGRETSGQPGRDGGDRVAAAPTDRVLPIRVGTPVELELGEPVAFVAGALPRSRDTHAGPLIRGIGAYLERCGHWHDWLDTQRAGLEVGRRLNNRQWEAVAAYNIGRGSGLLGEYNDGLTYLSMACDAFCGTGNLYGQANVYLTRSWVLDHQGELAEALLDGRRALDGYLAIGQRVGQGLALNCIGYTLTRIGDHEAALDYLHQALALHEEIDDPRGKAQTLDSLGLAYKGLGQYESAVAQLDRALGMLREIGDRPGQGETLLNLGDTHADTGNSDIARDMWQRALLIFEEFHHRPGVEKARERLGGHYRDRSDAPM